VTVDLSAFYLDVSKDRLYTFGAVSRERRSAQTAVYIIADGLARLLAPILSITADEIWGQLPGKRDVSVHLTVFPTSGETSGWRDDALENEWKQLLDLRRAVNAALEGARQRKEIGNALSAHVAIAAPASLTALLEKYRDDLAMLFITSDVRVEAGPGSDPVVTVTPATGEKCPRCWRFVPALMTGGTASGICPRCAEAVGATSGHAD
jgi:isoleucyl-tRNA synthetase